ncbi:MAG TPA: short-chain-enoyl-CoA hydratase [Candidatus Deferrimicrobium sp.]|nr:short-chain-enoyl-CoA hydratase [Candidatus Deferrimicrobium sp.]
MEYNNLLIERDGGVAIVTINRPKALNALNSEVLSELQQLFTEFATDKELGAVVITGSGEKSFVAGADITQMKEFNPIEGRNFGMLGQACFNKVENLPQPVIAAVNGFALGGGCELAMACDIRVAGENAKFGQPEVGLGVTAGFGGTQRLPRLVGRGKAKELLFTGDIIGAQEALEIGLVDRVVPAAEVKTYALELAKKILSKSPVAVQLTKSAVNKGLDMDLGNAQGYEAEVFGLCFSTEDQKEGMTAFVEKRKANFSGK